MPHIHGVAWISPQCLRDRGIDGTDVSKMKETDLIKLIDELISCELPQDDSKESQNLTNIVNEVQKHHHTKSASR